jgi:hypothetical protein|tara:strand:+ start:561 stop:1901 length:1341 start_codon:yes stop_codon:yes gene_type:complete
MAATEKLLKASGVLYTDRRNFYVDPQVTKELWTDVAPFTTMVSNQEMRKVPDPVFKMFEHRNPWVKQLWLCNSDTDNLNPDGTTITTITVDGASNISIDDSLKGIVAEVWTDGYGSKKGVVRVQSVTSSTVIVVTTMWTSNGSTIALANDDIFLVIGNAQGEGSSAPDAWSDELQVVYNSTQIFKTPLQVTGTLEAAVLRGESSELARLRRMKAQEHKMQKEKAFLFGKRFGGTGLQEASYGAGNNDTNNDETFADGGLVDSDGNLVRSTYGIISALETYGESTSTHDAQNVFTIDSSYGYADFVDDMEKVFQYIPETGAKRAFCGAGALGYWSKMAGASGLAGNSGWTVNLQDMKRDALGFNYRVLETPHGMLQLIPTPALRGPYNKYMAVVSDENLFHAVYRPSMYQTNIKTDNAFDGVKDQYMSDEGVGIQLIESHHLFKITA